MKFYFLFFIFVIFSVNLVLSLGYSPGDLNFNLKPQEYSCQIIDINSDSEIIAVSDKWAESKNDRWYFNLFNEDANYHRITINYPEIASSQESIEICLQGESEGEFHGLLLIKEEQEGNTISQGVIWLKVIISDNPEEQPTISLPTGTSGTSGGSSSGGGGVVVKNNATTTENNNEEVDDVDDVGEGVEVADGQSIDIENSKNIFARITGAVIGGGAENWKVIIGVIGFLIIAGAIVYNKKFRELEDKEIEDIKEVRDVK